MATIQTYTAQRGLSPAPTQTVAPDNTMAAALQDFGGAVSNLAASFADRQAKKDQFAAENAYRRFQLELESDLNNGAQNITPGGQGFHEAFMADVFRPKRDQFLASLPEDLRPRFEELLADDTGSDFAEWSINSATVERDEGYRWTKQEISLTQEQLATAIRLNPSAFEEYMEAGEALIDSGVLPTPERDLLHKQWREMAQVASLDAMLETDPQGVLRVLGVDTRQLSPTTQFQLLSRAVQWQESTDNPNAVSAKGAVGLMQVMPGTARDIAAALQDPNFPYGENDTVISAYLTNPFVNKRYGEEYLRQQLRQFSNTRNPIEAALVAYNAGPTVAQKWVESGYDDRVLSKETRDYKKAILDSISSPAAALDPGKVRFSASDGSGQANLEGVSQDLTNRVALAFSAVGLDNVKVNSAFRDPEHNAEVGGASDSEHTRGNALDINVAGMPLNERLDLIRSLSAAGVTGIGIYANTIHADVGGRRAWGPDHSSGSIPKWAQGVISEHLKGTTPPVRNVQGAYGDLSYQQQRAYIVRADQAISHQQAAASKADAVTVVETRRAMENELALVRTTGAPSGRLDETAISTVLGENAYLEFVDKRDLAQRVYTATNDIATLSLSDMAQRVEDYSPTPGASDFARQQEVQTAVQREVDRVIRLRSTDPGGAALAVPEVGAAWADLSAAENPAPNEVQDFVRLMLETQAQFDVAPEARAPIPNAWAIEIGRALSLTPEPAGRNLQEVRYAIQAQYDSLHQFFGDYTDDVIIHSLAEYKGISKTTAETIDAYMRVIQQGGDPFRRNGPTAAQAEDMDQVDSLSFWGVPNPLASLGRLFGGGSDATSGGDTGMSPEEMLRSMTPEE